MTIFRTEHKKNYTVINNTICTDRRISFKAKGIWLYAFSRPDDWEFHLCDLIKQSADGRDSVRAGLKELEECGYLVRCQHREVNGQMSKAEWIFRETPLIENCEPKAENPPTENPPTENSPTENHPLLSTDIQPGTDIQPSTEKQQHDAVGSQKIYDCLQSLNIPTRDKLEITQRNLEVTVKKAIAWAVHPQTKINKSLAAAIKWACENEPEVPKNAKDDVEENKSYAKRQEASYANGIIVECLSKHVEIVCTQSAKAPICIEYTEKGFKEQLNNALRKANIQPK